MLKGIKLSIYINWQRCSEFFIDNFHSNNLSEISEKMASFIKNAILYLMSEQCFDNYFVDFNLFDGKNSLFMQITRNYKSLYF